MSNEFGSSAAKAGFAAKLGSFLEAALPGPQDVLFLYIGFFGSLAEAKAKLRDEYYTLGFSEGTAANLLGFPPAWVREHLIKRAFDGSVGERVAGFSGVRESGSNQGAVDGYAFVRRLSDKQRDAFRAEGFATMAQKGQRISLDFNFDDVLALGLALKPRIEQMFEVASEQEAARLRAYPITRVS